MASSRLPPKVIDEWTKVKKELIPAIQKVKGAGMDDAFKKDMTTKVQALFTTFDGGLRDKLKKAADTKSDADAKKALQEVVKISAEYLKKLQAAQKQWGPIAGKGVGEIIEARLKAIHNAAELTLKALS